jgi:hypothetical protein
LKGGIGIALLVGLIVLALVSTHWVPLVAVVVVALAYLGYEYAAKR